LTGASFPWPPIVMRGWGVGLVTNGWGLCDRKPIGDADVQREIERLQLR
jgi:hypothetical protein